MNLETADESQESILRKLTPLLGRSKVLLTSRRRFKGDLFAIHLQGLDGKGALTFIRQEATDKNISHVLVANDSELQSIIDATGGSPLAMKLVVGQLSRLSLETVLGHLRNVLPLEGKTEEDDYIRFYRSIFLPSWELLTKESQKLLISMRHFPPGIGGKREAIQTISGLEGVTLERSINELWRFSFLEVGESLSIRQLRYYLHHLTHYFVQSDIAKELE